jgi:hypothetical protein
MSRKRSSRISFKDSDLDSDDDEEKKAIVPAGPASHFQSQDKRLGQIVMRPEEQEKYLKIVELQLLETQRRELREAEIREIKNERRKELKKSFHTIFVKLPVAAARIFKNLFLEAFDFVSENPKIVIGSFLLMLAQQALKQIGMSSAEFKFGPFGFSFNKD